MNKPIFRAKDHWVLCTCNNCGRLNYVEPHGTTAACKCSFTETEHSNIPFKYRDPSGTRLLHKPIKGLDKP